MNRRRAMRKKVGTVGDRVRDGELYSCYNAITAAEGMRYFKGKYYKDGDKIYLCTRDDSGGDGTVMHYLPSQLAGIYFEEVTG